MQGNVRDFSISIVKKNSTKQNNYGACCEKNKQNQGHLVEKERYAVGKNAYIMLRLLNFLGYTRINWDTCDTLCTLFVKPWLMNNKQQVRPTEAWKYHFINSWNSCLMYGWFCNVHVIFLSFDTSHWPAIWHSTIGWGGGEEGRLIWYTRQLQIWRQPVTIQKPEITGKCHYRFLHN